jgi:hypothetical protein
MTASMLRDQGYAEVRALASSPHAITVMVVGRRP